MNSALEAWFVSHFVIYEYMTHKTGRSVILQMFDYY